MKRLEITEIGKTGDAGAGVSDAGALTLASAAISCGELLIKLLENYGVELVFGIPGVHTVELYRGLARSRLRHITPRHEQGAGFMADGYARVSGKPGVCFIITGPGMTNIATAMAQAYADSIPMLVISSVNARQHLGNGNGMLHELPSQRAVFSGMTAFSHTLMSADELPAVLARAFAVFDSARPRPVHIEIPLDIIVALATAAHLSCAMPARSSKPCADPRSVAAAAAMLRQAKRPLILAGGGAVNAAIELQQLAERLQAPTALTINAKGLLPPQHPLLLGSTQSTAATRALVCEADVVLAIGTELGETDYDTVFDGGFRIPGKLIRIDIDALQLARNYPPSLALLSDTGSALQGLLQHLPPLPESPLHASLSDASWGSNRVAALRRTVDASLDHPARMQQRMLEVVANTLPDAIYVGDSTQPVYTGNITFDARTPRSWFNSSTGYGTLGYALPAAIGAKLAAANASVVCLIGDGGLQFTLPELASAVEAGVPVIILLWNNSGYGEIKKYMQNRAIEPVGVDIYTPDFLAIARGFGCSAVHAATATELTRALQQAKHATTPTVIEISETEWTGQEQ
ncbi:5-guanidino-2-oxopentanoate decarboxylase [Collimonas sp.]|jgi:acetolactate synthase-1/2/3 large subunit|uniref:5-guanidino-2-oxopentanoate decarboxylase n=1 Tax=Collimonas sp. TaxID=1963772 RepID=UPI002C430523|nr:5-guanidino-2-oxopentanoate decarboxylase [Collimonas sp.]HWW08065.1 5-guanidino-2-oxopentanoate decarboxylase [Collimonas sp.]